MFRENITGKKDEERFNKKFGVWFLNSSFKASIRNKNPSQLMNTIIGVEARLGALKNQVQSYLEDYLIRGGFPNSVTSPSLIEAAQILKQDLELTVYKDIHRLFNTRDPSKMMSVLTSIAEQTNTPISMNQIAKKSETSWPVIDNFLDYFEQTFLINKIPFYSNENSTTKSDMIKLNDTGILNTLLSQLHKNILDEDINRLVSTAITSHAVRLLFKTSQYLERKIYYWEEENDAIEVILTKPNLIPIGIAYDENILADKIYLVSKFMTKNKLKFGIVITKDEIDVKGDILLFPMWSFLLMC
jgi:predicted AAA+ superfamily ATPase